MPIGKKVEFKIVFARNLDDSVTSEDVAKLMGFHETPFLRKHTCVEIKTDGRDRYAKVVVPETILAAVMEFNGVQFYGKKITVESEEGESEDATDAGDEGNSSTSQENTTEDKIEYLLLNCRRPEWNFNPIQEYEICDAIQLDHANDPHKLVKTLWGRDLGLFRVYSQDMGRYADKNLIIRGMEVTMQPIRKRKNHFQVFTDETGRSQGPIRRGKSFDPDGIKIKIKDAWEPQHQDIPHSDFDEFFQSLGAEVIIQTQPERCYQNRHVNNTNRYLVVKKYREDGSEINFGKFLSVAGKSFQLWYREILIYCGLCAREHGWDCPTRARHNFMKALRKEETEKMKIYSDSTMRHTNQLALRTDVACMSGGSIAQICNAIPYDDIHEEVTI